MIVFSKAMWLTVTALHLSCQATCRTMNWRLVSNSLDSATQLLFLRQCQVNGALTWTLCPNLARVPSLPLDRAENPLVTSNRGEKRTSELDQSKCSGSTLFRFSDCHIIHRSISRVYLSSEEPVGGGGRGWRKGEVCYIHRLIKILRWRHSHTFFTNTFSLTSD